MPLRLLPGNVPPLLRNLPHWVVWKIVPASGKGDAPRLGKLPLRCSDGRRAASVADPSTWGTFDEALACLKHNPGLAGIAFALTADAGIVGIDLDHVLTDGDIRTLPAWLRPAFSTLKDATYVEVSPSGDGIHAFTLAELAPGRRKGRNIELYADRRFLTVTGHSFKSPPNDVCGGVQAAVTYLQSCIEKEAQERNAGHIERSGADRRKNVPLVGIDLTDRELLEKARNAANGMRFASLFFDGDISPYPSHSEADMALAMRIAWWTGPDPERIDRLMRESALLRASERLKKWERPAGNGMTYGERTVARVISLLEDWYQPELESSVAPSC